MCVCVGGGGSAGGEGLLGLLVPIRGLGSAIPRAGGGGGRPHRLRENHGHDREQHVL